MNDVWKQAEPPPGRPPKIEQRYLIAHCIQALCYPIRIRFQPTGIIRETVTGPSIPSRNEAFEILSGEFHKNGRRLKAVSVEDAEGIYKWFQESIGISDKREIKRALAWVKKAPFSRVKLRDKKRDKITRERQPPQQQVTPKQEESRIVKEVGQKLGSEKAAQELMEAWLDGKIPYKELPPEMQHLFNDE